MNARSPRGLLRTSLGVLLVLLVGGAPASAGAGPQKDTAFQATDELLAALQAKYEDGEKKYAALAKKIKKEVDKLLKKGTWSAGDEDPAPLADHPFFGLIDELSAEAAAAGKKKNSTRTKELLENYPWQKDLELVIGTQHGSDREIPSHENGFIHLGSTNTLRGFPDLVPNIYLYGFQEVVGWQYSVASKKEATFGGRTSKDQAEMADELSGWEAIRVYLEGSVPEVPLYAIPMLTHRIHSRLAERRAADSEEARKVDECLAFLDSKWNGFTFEVPFSKNPVAFVAPAHFLFTDSSGFVHGFRTGERLSGTGDIPFVSVQAIQHYAKQFLGKEIGVREFIGETPLAKEADAAFLAASTYLARYKTLIDLLVRAILSPNLRYPSYMRNFDYPEGKMLAARKIERAYDVPRKHALIVWAYAGKDPAAVADFLYDNLLSDAANQFPADVALPVQFTLKMREKEQDMLSAIATRIADEHAEAGKATPFELEFSPNGTYLEIQTDVASDYLVYSYASFHAHATDAVRQAAHAVVAKELGK